MLLWSAWVWLLPSLVATPFPQGLPPWPLHLPLVWGVPLECPLTSGRRFKPPLEGVQPSPQGLAGGPPRGEQLPPLPPGSSSVAPVPTSAGGAAQRAASSSKASLSSRAKKKARGFIPWNPSADQLSHAQLLLRGSGRYYMDPPLCLSINDPRMGGRPSSQKWRCAYCALHFYSQLDCQGHALAAHSDVRSPPLCPCGTTFNSAKALRDHLALQHNINATGVKSKDPPVPLLLDNTRPMRPPPTGGN